MTGAHATASGQAAQASVVNFRQVRGGHLHAILDAQVSAGQLYPASVIHDEFQMSRWSSSRARGCACLLAAWAVFGASDCLGDTTYAATSTTPFDRQMRPTLPILQTPSGRAAGDTSFATINRWILELRVVPYEYSLDWQTPAQLASAVVTDCKGKSALLYARMRTNGLSPVYFVIGKRRATDLATHAWVEWRTDRGTYVLDPTFSEVALPVRALQSATYIPRYAYDGFRKYRVRRSTARPARAVVKK